MVAEIHAAILGGAHVIERLVSRCKRIAASRPPDFVIRHGETPYLSRWFLIPRNRVFNLYLHRFDADDEDRALHDHPWFNVSVLLEGSYREHSIRAGGVHASVERSAGAIKFRSPWAAHRIELTTRPTWTLFITGPVLRTWGFHCPNGWRRWKEFVDERDSGKVGRGCT